MFTSALKAVVSNKLCKKTSIFRTVIRLCHENTRYRKKPPIGKGGRFLDDSQEGLFQFNAWDNVQWGPEQEEEAIAKLRQNSTVKLDQEAAEKYEKDAAKFWDDFYSTHENKFFKDRHWLLTEYPELLGPTAGTVVTETCEKQFPGRDASFRVLEVGCGVGNTVFPLLETYREKNHHVYCCDFSSKAVEIVQSQSEYDPARCTAFVCDVTADVWDVPFPENSLDVILLIFVLSAIAPDKMQAAVDKLSRYLKPSGRILFRDYGRYDMAELRFKSGRCLAEHFYVRGDGTRVYFFSQEELKSVFEKAGLIEEQNIVDRRLLVNRGRHLKMYRVWIQCKYQKPQ